MYTLDSQRLACEGNLVCRPSESRKWPIDMTVEEHRNLTLVQAVLLRPRIFTVNGTLVELLSFFRGCMHHPHGEAAQDDGSLRMLFDWLSQECDIDSRSLFPTRIYDALIARFGDDQAALDFIRAESLAPEDHVILL